ncbi:MAG TPA: DUF2079 domain-containing protein [Actinomycetes bacterium]|nr:DUF2079 domain-containing protein [Actinomycetes bacterium]
MTAAGSGGARTATRRRRPPLLHGGQAAPAGGRTSVEVWCRIGLVAAVAIFLAAFGAKVWLAQARFATHGFDVGIFDQAAWLLSRLRDPYSTVTHLPFFGDHASYLLVAFAPLYRLWADPRVLLLAQVAFLAVPAVVVYRIAVRRLRSEAAGLVLALAYLAYPAMQWAAVFEFHLETIAAGCIALAYLAAEEGRPRLMVAWLVPALLAKEDVALVVAGFGVMLALTAGDPAGGRVGSGAGTGWRRRWGWWVAAGALAWFAVVTFALVPLVLGAPSRHLQRSYGVSGNGLGALVAAVPTVGGNALRTLASAQGARYLALVLLPLAALPLAAWRWLLPALPPLLLNLASVHQTQHEITYQYLATASPVLAVAAVAGTAWLAARRRRLLAPALAVLLLTSAVASASFGAAPWTRQGRLPADSPVHDARRAAVARVAPDAPVSAGRDLVPHLAHRTVIYEFPNPWRAVNWGLQGDPATPAEQASVRFVVVEPGVLSPPDRAVLDRLRADQGTWRTAFDQRGILMLERRTSAAAAP